MPANTNIQDDRTIALELTDEIQKKQIVTTFLYSFSSQSVILQLNREYANKIVEVHISIDDWKLTSEDLNSALTNKGVNEADRVKLLRLLNANSNRIVDHFSKLQRRNLHAGRKAKLERKEKAKSTPPIEVSISQALRMHEGNIRVKGIISGSSAKVEDMYSLIGFRCGECDMIVELARSQDLDLLTKYHALT